MSIFCDLVLLTCGNLEALRPCVETLLAMTRTPSRLIVVDNDSGEETKAYLGSIRGNERITVEVITNERNEGFVLGMNRGMKLARAPYVALLNDDLIFTDDWLGRILEAGQKYPQTGILNPSSNTFGHHPPGGWTPEQYAQERRRRFPGQVVRVATASGFCMVIKRELIQKIGYLDEVFVPIFFEDTDYSCRAAAAGYHSVIVKDAYVYHHEHRSFFRIKKQPEVYTRNKSIFHQRWGRTLRILAPFRVGPQFDTRTFREQLDVLSEWSFQRCFLHVPLNVSKEGVLREIDKAFSLQERSGIQFFPFSVSPLFDLYCAYRLLVRRKKPFDCLFFFDSTKADPILKRFSRLLRLPIFSVEGETLVVLDGRGRREMGPFRASEFPALAREVLR